MGPRGGLRCQGDRSPGMAALELGHGQIEPRFVKAEITGEGAREQVCRAIQLSRLDGEHTRSVQRLGEIRREFERSSVAAPGFVRLTHRAGDVAPIRPGAGMVGVESKGGLDRLSREVEIAGCGVQCRKMVMSFHEGGVEGNRALLRFNRLNTLSQPVEDEGPVVSQRLSLIHISEPTRPY